VNQLLDVPQIRPFSSVSVTPGDSNKDQIWDHPQLFSQIVHMDSQVFWKLQGEEPNARFVVTHPLPTYTNVTQLPDLQDVIWLSEPVVYVQKPGVFLQHVTQPYPQLHDVSAKYQVRPGRKDLAYMWKHYAHSNSRIDPAIQNVIDIYVLTSNYDQAVRNWISKGRMSDAAPKPPSAEELRLTFGDFDRYKMMSDQIVWHPVKYRLLFGKNADLTDQAVFKVVKASGTSVTDSEIRSRVIQAVDAYFSVINWDFGQSFYFTELAAFIHQQMPTLLSSVVIVPVNYSSQFGSLFEIQAAPDQMFISAARVTDVQIVPNLTPSELRLLT
jgi:hypothetical protein